MTLVPEYVLREAHSCKSDPFGADKMLPAGAYIKPINFYYISALTKERWPSFNPETQVFCYTAYGIIPIPKSLVRLR